MTIAWILAGLAASAMQAGQQGERAKVPALHPVAEFKKAFNEAKGDVRVVIILAPS